jgi:uncharacterized protein (TIGR00255 family)
MSQVRSMTGFGQAQVEGAELRVAVSVRTVNHRNLDLVLRLPDDLRPLERRIGDCLRAELRRGRVEVRVEVTQLGERACEVRVSRRAVAELRRAAEEIGSEGLIERGLGFADLLRLPEVVRLSFAPHSWTEEEQGLVLDAVAAARDQAAAARRHEGQRLAEIVGGFLDELAGLLDSIEDRRPEAQQRLEDAFRRRLDELLAGPPPNEDRLAQEVAMLVERTDVQEEIDRLRAHFEHGRRLLGSSEPIGRRLEFLSQELLREINTLGAKSRDLPILRNVLDAKAACDRLREQVQNIE